MKYYPIGTVVVLKNGTWPFMSYERQQITKKSIQVTDHYSVHIGLAPSFKLTGLQISLQSGSIIITDMLHRPVLLPHILSDHLAPYLCFNVMFQHFLTFTPIKEQVHLGEST